MRITLNTDSGSYPLAGQWDLSDREFSGVVDFRISAEHIQEINRRVRSETAQVFHRGNLATTISFSTRRVFATHAEALTFAADLDAETERVGTVMLAPGNGNARHLQDAVVDPPAHEVDGCAVRLSYVATGTAVERLLPPVSISSAGAGLVVSPGGGGTMPEEIEDAQLDGVIIRMVNDSLGYWAEVGFPSPTDQLVGNAESGWMDPGGNLLFRIGRSNDLQTWDHAVTACPTGIDDLGDDVWMYWARAKAPISWQTTLRDFRIGGENYGKSITSISYLNAEIPLTGYPYAMPADKARLQSDLRTAGYTGAIVSSTSAALSTRINNYTAAGRRVLTVTMSGTNVTGVANYATGPISLPSYPYSMPSQKAALQSALRTAGYTGAVVTLYADPWEIFLPDRNVTGGTLPFNLTFSPADPFKVWDFFGNYQGEAPGNNILGAPENVRTPGGDPLEESLKQFFRLEVSAGPNNRY